MTKISARQLYFFLACIAPVGKLVILPAKLTEYVGNDLLLPALFHFLLQAAAVFLVLLLAKRNMSLFELLSARLGKILGGAATMLVSLFLVIASFFPLLEQKLFVQGTFYDTIPSVAAFAPFFLFSAYLCSKPLPSQGRAFDILAPIAIVGLAGILVLAVTNADYAAILPVGGSGARALLRGVSYSTSWFFDAALLLMLLGKFRYEKGMAWKGALCYLAGGLAALLFMATFYGIFEETAINQLFAFSNASKYFSGITVLGRVDFLFIYALALVMIFYCSLPVQAGIEGVLEVFGRKKYLPTLLSIGINLCLFLGMVYFDFRFGDAMMFFSKRLFWLYPLFSVLLPLALLLFGGKRHARE